MEVHGAQLAQEVGADVVFAKEVIVLGDPHEVDMLAVTLVLQENEEQAVFGRDTEEKLHLPTRCQRL